MSKKIENIADIVNKLKEYSGPDIRIMEICGSHTAAIAKNGIRDLISPKIHLVSGPGCPVCVTPSSYIDRLVELACTPKTCVVTFGDLLRVPGSKMSLSQAKGQGAECKMVYSPADILKLAKEEPETQFVFAAVGFETTTPIYALLLENLEKENITNVKLLTALKTMPPAVTWLLKNKAHVDAFIAPGHVCVITGSRLFEPLAAKYEVPFGVAGFGGEELLFAIYGIVNMLVNKKPCVKNYYPAAVTEGGNVVAQEKVARWFQPADAVWRGMGVIPDSGLVLKTVYEKYDAGSKNLVEDIKINKACCCDKVLTGKMEPQECPLFRTVCNPGNPQGACMVSTEGSCFSRF